MHHVAVIGIGGLGHIAIKLLKAWGCEITAFSSNPDKTAELLAMGADHVVNSRDAAALKTQRGKFDLILSTVNVSLDWGAYLSNACTEWHGAHVGSLRSNLCKLRRAA